MKFHERRAKSALLTLVVLTVECIHQSSGVLTIPKKEVSNSNSNLPAPTQPPAIVERREYQTSGQNYNGNNNQKNINSQNQNYNNFNQNSNNFDNNNNNNFNQNINEDYSNGYSNISSNQNFNNNHNNNNYDINNSDTNNYSVNNNNANSNTYSNTANNAQFVQTTTSASTHGTLLPPQVLSAVKGSSHPAVVPQQQSSPTIYAPAPIPDIPGHKLDLPAKMFFMYSKPDQALYIYKVTKMNLHPQSIQANLDTPIPNYSAPSTLNQNLVPASAPKNANFDSINGPSYSLNSNVPEQTKSYAPIINGNTNYKSNNNFNNGPSPSVYNAPKSQLSANSHYRTPTLLSNGNRNKESGFNPPPASEWIPMTPQNKPRPVLTQIVAEGTHYSSTQHKVLTKVVPRPTPPDNTYGNIKVPVPTKVPFHLNSEANYEQLLKQMQSQNSNYQSKPNYDQPKQTFDYQPKQTFDQLSKPYFDKHSRLNVDDRPRDNFNQRPQQYFDNQPRHNFDSEPKESSNIPTQHFEKQLAHSYENPSKDNFDYQPKQNFNNQPTQNFDSYPKQNFEPPPQSNYEAPPQQNYESPQKQNYEIPPKQNYEAPPQQNYESPLKQNYESPPKQNYESRPNQNYDSPAPQQNYESPPKQNYENPIKQNVDIPRKQNFDNQAKENQPQKNVDQKSKLSYGPPPIQPSVTVSSGIAGPAKPFVQAEGDGNDVEVRVRLRTQNARVRDI